MIVTQGNMNAWWNLTRSSTLRLCLTLTTTCCRSSHLHARRSYAAHCEYQGPDAPRNRNSFGLANQRPWFESDRKRVILNQTMIKQSQHDHHNVSDLCFEVHRIWDDIHRASIRRLIHSCRHRVRNSLAPNIDVSFFKFKKSSALNGAMNLLGQRLDSSYLHPHPHPHPQGQTQCMTRAWRGVIQ